MSTCTTPGRNESTTTSQKPWSTLTPQEIAKRYPRLEALLYDCTEWSAGPVTDLVETWSRQFSAAVQVLESLCSDIGNTQLWAVFHSMKAHELMLEDIVKFLYAASVKESEARQEETPDEAWSPRLLAAHRAVDTWHIENKGLIEAMDLVRPDNLPNDEGLPMWSLIHAMRRHNEALLETAFPMARNHGKQAAATNTESPEPAPVQ
jgi:hypothetical protein